MSDIQSETSYYRLYWDTGYLEPKLFYDKDPIKAESLESEVIYDQIEKPRMMFNPHEIIRHSDIETLWKSGHYDNDYAPFKMYRLTNISEISEYYMPEHSVRYDVDTPFFMPTDKLYLNNSMHSVDEQWKIFTAKTGITRKQQKKLNLIVDNSVNEEMAPVETAPPPLPLEVREANVATPSPLKQLHEEHLQTKQRLYDALKDAGEPVPTGKVRKMDLADLQERYHNAQRRIAEARKSTPKAQPPAKALAPSPPPSSRTPSPPPSPRTPSPVPAKALAPSPASPASVPRSVIKSPVHSPQKMTEEELAQLNEPTILKLLGEGGVRLFETSLAQWKKEVKDVGLNVREEQYEYLERRLREEQQKERDSADRERVERETADRVAQEESERKQQEFNDLIEQAYTIYKQQAQPIVSLTNRLAAVKQKMLNKERLSHDEDERKKYEEIYGERALEMQYYGLLKLKHEIEEDLAKEEEQQQAMEQYEREQAHAHAQAQAENSDGYSDEDILQGGGKEVDRTVVEVTSEKYAETLTSYISQHPTSAISKALKNKSEMELFVRYFKEEKLRMTFNAETSKLKFYTAKTKKEKNYTATMKEFNAWKSQAGNAEIL